MHCILGLRLFSKKSTIHSDILNHRYRYTIGACWNINMELVLLSPFLLFPPFFPFPPFPPFFPPFLSQVGVTDGEPPLLQLQARSIRTLDQPTLADCSPTSAKWPSKSPLPIDGKWDCIFYGRHWFTAKVSAMSVYVLLPLFAHVYLVKASSTLCCDKNDNINAPKSCQVWYKLALVPECCKQLSALLMCAHHKWVSSVSVTNNAGRCVIPAISECQPIKIAEQLNLNSVYWLACTSHSWWSGSQMWWNLITCTLHSAFLHCVDNEVIQFLGNVREDTDWV